MGGGSFLHLIRNERVMFSSIADEVAPLGLLEVVVSKGIRMNSVSIGPHLSGALSKFRKTCYIICLYFLKQFKSEPNFTFKLRNTEDKIAK